MELIHTAYQPSGRGPFPTLLTLHGRGANAFDLLGLAPYLCGGRFMVVCPQAPLETPIGPESVGYAWYPMSLGGPPSAVQRGPTPSPPPLPSIRDGLAPADHL